jgi:putative tricarboxylic transport membrane protein
MVSLHSDERPIARIALVGNTSAAVRRTDLVCGGCLVALGALSLVEALRLRDDWQGAKLVPALVGAVLVLLGVAHLRARATEPPAWPDAVNARRVVVMFVVLVLYVAVLPWLGFLPATVLFVLVLVRSLGTYSWTRSIVVTMAIAAGTHVVFKHWLGMPLPAGPLGL